MGYINNKEIINYSNQIIQKNNNYCEAVPLFTNVKDIETGSSNKKINLPFSSDNEKLAGLCLNENEIIIFSFSQQKIKSREMGIFKIKNDYIISYLVTDVLRNIFF